LPVSVVVLPDPCSQVLSEVRNAMALAIQGYAGAANAAALDPGNLACLNTSAASYKANTGVLVVRRADTLIAGATPTANYFNIQTSGCLSDVVPYVVDVPSGTFNMHSNAGGCTPATTVNTIAPLYTRIYFVSNCSGTDCSAAGADTVPTLKRLDVRMTGASPIITPIVDGIEDLQLDYGIDTTAAPGDGTPDVYTNTPVTHPAVTPTTPAEWVNVMSVRVSLLARNIDESGIPDTKTYTLGPRAAYAPGGSFRRHAYNALVRLYNVAQVRE